jgi:Holliday junction DNA helicase RuvA
MLHYVRGKVAHTEEQEVVVEVSGIGLSVLVPNAILFQKNSLIELQLYMHWNQEQGPTLFGFSSLLEKKVFLLIISCSGIGPKIALALLAQMRPSDFVQAITTSNLDALSSVSGIGRKKAEQIIVQLRHKIGPLTESLDEFVESADTLRFKDVADALASLSYSRQEITRAMQYLQEQQGGKPFDELFRHALSFLAKRKQL